VSDQTAPPRPASAADVVAKAASWLDEEVEIQRPLGGAYKTTRAARIAELVVVRNEAAARGQPLGVVVMEGTYGRRGLEQHEYLELEALTTFGAAFAYLFGQTWNRIASERVNQEAAKHGTGLMAGRLPGSGSGLVV
jgi:hypothetical protein